MGNILSAFIGTLVVCYLKTFNKVSSLFKGNSDGNSNNDYGLNSGDKYEVIDIRKGGKGFDNGNIGNIGNLGNVGNSGANSNAKCEYQLLKTCDEIEVKSTPDKEVEELQNEIKAIPFENDEVGDDLKETEMIEKVSDNEKNNENENENECDINDKDKENESDNIKDILDVKVVKDVKKIDNDDNFEDLKSQILSEDSLV